MHEDLYDRRLTVGSFYHVYNRGVARGDIFQDSSDYYRFLEAMRFYIDDDRPAKLSTARKTKDSADLLVGPPMRPLTSIRAYCLMPNHFHLLLEEITEKGISDFMRRWQLSYTRYFNTRYNRVGPLFQGMYRFVRVENDEQYLHLTRYIHLNPFVAGLTGDPETYHWSSYSAHRQPARSRLCDPGLALQLAGSSERYQNFVRDLAGYTHELTTIQHQLIDVAID